jgi:hypothetical protein
MIGNFGKAVLLSQNFLRITPVGQEKIVDILLCPQTLPNPLDLHRFNLFQ